MRFRLKSVIAVALAAFALASLVYGGATEVMSRRNAAAPASPAPAKRETAEVIVFFFDSDKQCTTCDHLRDYAAEAVKTHFASELASGTIEWRMLNMDDPANEHFVTDFGLFSKSVVLARVDDGRVVRWKNLESIWELVYDKRAYVEYIRNEIGAFLAAVSRAPGIVMEHLQPVIASPIPRTEDYYRRTGRVYRGSLPGAFATAQPVTAWITKSLLAHEV